MLCDLKQIASNILDAVLLLWNAKPAFHLLR